MCIKVIVVCDGCLVRCLNRVWVCRKKRHSCFGRLSNLFCSGHYYTACKQFTCVKYQSGGICFTCITRLGDNFNKWVSDTQVQSHKLMNNLVDIPPSYAFVKYVAGR